MHLPDASLAGDRSSLAEGRHGHTLVLREKKDIPLLLVRQREILRSPSERAEFNGGLTSWVSSVFGRPNDTFTPGSWSPSYPLSRRKRSHCYSCACPLWVRSGHWNPDQRCPLYPRKRTYRLMRLTSAVPLCADASAFRRKVAFLPSTECRNLARQTTCQSGRGTRIRPRGHSNDLRSQLASRAAAS